MVCVKGYCYSVNPLQISPTPPLPDKRSACPYAPFPVHNMYSTLLLDSGMHTVIEISAVLRDSWQVHDCSAQYERSLTGAHSTLASTVPSDIVLLCATRKMIANHSLGGACAHGETIVARVLLLLVHHSTPRFCECECNVEVLICCQCYITMQYGILHLVTPHPLRSTLLVPALGASLL